MAVAVLVLWLCTAAVGSYMLATSIRPRHVEPDPEPRDPVPARPLRDKDRFDPVSLQEAKSEPLPGMTDLAEFAHPTLAMIGFGFWFGYVVSHDRTFLAIAIGVMAGAIAAGLSWFTANTRAAKRAARVEPGTAGETAEDSGATVLAAPRLLILHGLGAALTLLIAALIAARV